VTTVTGYADRVQISTHTFFSAITLAAIVIFWLGQ
jgi:hypothetical protein